MTTKSVVRTRWLPRAALYVVVLLVPLVSAGCNLDLCKIFNCETLFFMEDLSQALQDLGAGSDTGTGDEHDDADMDGDGDDMDMDGDGGEHDEGAADDGHDD